MAWTISPSAATQSGDSRPSKVVAAPYIESRALSAQTGCRLCLCQYTRAITPPSAPLAPHIMAAPIRDSSNVWAASIIFSSGEKRESLGATPLMVPPPPDNGSTRSPPCGVVPRSLARPGRTAIGALSQHCPFAKCFRAARLRDKERAARHRRDKAEARGGDHMLIRFCRRIHILIMSP